MNVVGQLNRYSIQPLFSFYVDLDAENPAYDIGQMTQGGTALPQGLYQGTNPIQ